MVETAVPCCIRHVAKQDTPALTLPYLVPYTHALKQFQKYERGEDRYEKEAELKILITRKCGVIASKLSDTSYTIPSKVEGVEPIRDLVRHHSVRERSHVD